ncbi:hypothetical protein O181_007837 [Austropuccinia psidii MF-1]|uniref:Uncharacterized protein n=1 Tax=Austropuccinia psidii MF-1 TaxID=1389203 RepID=A0A9Q3BNL1_9BASI|nr:hypothetical protein [Austropuccinia psidii MF-1]
MLVMLANKNIKNACLLFNPSDHATRGVPMQDALMMTPSWSTMMKAFQRGTGHQSPKQEDRNISRQLAWCPQVSICPPPPPRPPSNGHFTP